MGKLRPDVAAAIAFTKDVAALQEPGKKVKGEEAAQAQ